MNLQNMLSLHVVHHVKSYNMNRIRIILAEKNKTNKWLAEQLGKSVTAISRRVRNKNQPSLNQLVGIAKVSEVDAKDLLVTTLIK